MEALVLSVLGMLSIFISGVMARDNDPLSIVGIFVGMLAIFSVTP
jgi:hypothetical protein